MLPSYKVVDVTNGMQYPNGRSVNIHDHVVGWNNTSQGINQGFIQLGGQGTKFVKVPAGSSSKSGTYVMSINNNRVAVWNWEEIETKICHAFIWENGQLTDLGPLIGASSCAAMDINDRGQIVGIADFGPIPSGTPVDELGMKGHAFLYETNGGGVTDLGVLAGHSMSRAEAVNELGQVVGISAHWDAPSYTQYSVRPFLYKDGSLNELTGEEGTAVDINDLGHVLGASQVASPSGSIQNHPYIWRDGNVEPIPLDNAAPKAINNGDEVVGEVVSNLPYHCFLFRNGQVVPNLNTLVGGQLPAGANISGAEDINDKGHILVWGTRPSWGAFMALLVPDKATLRVKVEGLRELVLLILFGVSHDGGGWVLIGKTIRRIPPWGPLSIDHWELVFEYASALLRDTVEDQSDLEEARRELRRVIDEGIAGHD